MSILGNALYFTLRCIHITQISEPYFTMRHVQCTTQNVPTVDCSRSMFSLFLENLVTTPAFVSRLVQSLNLDVCASNLSHVS